MAFKKGQPKVPGSGKKKGSHNKSTLAVRERALQLKIDPFEVLLYFTAGDWRALGYDAAKTITGYSMAGDAIEDYTIPPALRQKAAKDACEYLHPKLKSIEHSIPPGEAGVQGVIIYQAQWGGTSESDDDEDTDKGS